MGNAKPSTSQGITPAPDQATGTPPDAMAAPPPERMDLRLMELMVCPVTKTTLSYDSARQELISRAARLAFPIRNGVALLTVDAARDLED
jgi:uncharacterized protein